MSESEIFPYWAKISEVRFVGILNQSGFVSSMEASFLNLPVLS